MDGRIKLHRKILDNPIASNGALIGFLCYILLSVSHKEKEFFLGMQKIQQKKGEGIFSQKKLSKQFGVSRGTVGKRLSVLQGEQVIDIKTTNKYTVVKVINRDKYQVDGHQNDIKMTSKGHQNDTINKEKNYKNNNIVEIINYLNRVAGTNYKPTTKKTKALVNARMNDGFELDDFKKVIKSKVNEWKNTDMFKFVRPETLFGTKFEGYLNSSEDLYSKDISVYAEEWQALGIRKFIDKYGEEFRNKMSKPIRDYLARKSFDKLR